MPPSPCPEAAELWKELIDAVAVKDGVSVDHLQAPDGRPAPVRLPRVRVAGPSQPGVNVKLALFGGLHGDEPSSVTGVLRFLLDVLADPEPIGGVELHAIPFCNPTGLAAGTRHNDNGLDLNREFWRGSLQPEVALIEHFFRSHRLDGVITLHADDTAPGCYGYSWGRVLNEALLVPALEAASTALPVDTRDCIDGFPACNGTLRDCFHGVLAPDPRHTPRPFEIIFETPALAPLAAQTEAHRRAVHAVIAAHRRLLSYASDL